MENIAICYENTVIYWNEIIIAAALLSGFFVYLFMFVGKRKFSFSTIPYFVIAVLFSVLISRFLHWYSHIEQYDSLKAALTDYRSGSYILSGVLIAIFLTAWIFRLMGFVKQSTRLIMLDSISVATCFIFAMIRFSDAFTENCLGKYSVSVNAFKRIPFASLGSDGEYHLASYYLSFMMLLIIFIVLFVCYVRKSNVMPGFITDLFIILYNATEIFTDSTRYDASHLYFPGKSLANLNKGAGFIGMSQIIAAIFFIVLMVKYTKAYIKNKDAIAKKRHIPVWVYWITFLAGIGLVGAFEYVVQRHSSSFIFCYTFQILGIILMSLSCILPLIKLRKIKSAK